MSEPDAEPEFINAEQVREAVATALLDEDRRKARLRFDLAILKAAAEARSWLGELTATDATEALEAVIESAAARLSDPWSLP